MRKIFIGLFFVIQVSLLIQCSPPDPCRKRYIIHNTSSVHITVIALNTTMYNDISDDTLSMNSGRGYSFFYSTDCDGYETNCVSYLNGHDSVEIIFNYRDTAVFYRNLESTNYSRSLFNISAYESDDCEYTFTFTEDDYNAAKSK